MFWHLIWQTSCVTCPSGSGYKTVLLIWKARSRKKPATLNASCSAPMKNTLSAFFQVFAIKMAILQTCLYHAIMQKAESPTHFPKGGGRPHRASQSPGSTAHLHSRTLLPSLPLPKHATANFPLLPHSSRCFLSSAAVCCFYKHIHAWFPQSHLTDLTEGAARGICRLQAENHSARFGTCDSWLPLSDHPKITLKIKLFILILFHLAFIPLYS